MSFLPALVALFWVCLVVPSVSQTWCTETQECAGTSIYDELIYCWGYNACANSEIDGGLCDCAGFSACFSSAIDLTDDTFCESEDACALSTISAGGNLYCGGYYSCAGATDINSTGIVECPGEAACRYAEVINTDDGMYCFGDYGCWYTKIGGTSLIYSWGYRSTYFADIDTTDVDTMTVSFAGYYSGYQAQIMCAEDSTCNINCDESTSCDGVIIYCYGTCNVDCDDGYDCPTEYYYDSADYDTRLQWDAEKESKAALRSKHKKEFDALMREINAQSGVRGANGNWKKQKTEKLAKFDAYVEGELQEWSAKYNREFDPTSIKSLSVAPTAHSSTIKGNNAEEKASGLSMAFMSICVLLAVSVMANGYLIAMRNKKATVWPSYQALA